MKIGELRSAEAQAFNNGKIGFTEAKKLADQAVTDGDQAALLKQFQGDAFDLTPKQRKALEAELGGKISNGDPIVGKKLGSLSDSSTGGISVDLTVRKSFGPKGGYDNEWQAAAAARMSGSDRAVVVETPKGRWNAVETNIPMEQASQFDPQLDIENVYPQKGKFNPAYYADLKKAAVEAKNANPRDDQAVADAYTKLAAYTYGVPEDQIKIITNHDQREAGKINVNVGAAAAEDGQTGNPKSGSSAFDPKIKTPATEVNSIAFTDDPEHAQSVLFHEGTHVHNDKVAHDLYDKYATKHGKGESFDHWLNNEVKHKHISKETQEITSGIYNHDFRNDEASAYTAAFIGSFAAHPDGSKPNRLADELEGAGQYARDNGSPDAGVQESLNTKMRDYYRTLTPEQQTEFKSAIDKAKKAAFDPAEQKKNNKQSNWVANIDYSKW